MRVELKEENERLLKLLSQQGVDPTKAGDASSKDTDEERKAMQALLDAQIEENRRLMADMQKTWEERRSETKSLRESDEVPHAACRGPRSAHS